MVFCKKSFFLLTLPDDCSKKLLTAGQELTGCPSLAVFPTVTRFE